MEKYDVYLFQYSEGNKITEDRFYVKKSETLDYASLFDTINTLNICEISKTLFPKSKSKHYTQKDIADLVEENVLEKQGFIKVSGIKEINECHHEKNKWNVFNVEIKKQHLWARI